MGDPSLEALATGVNAARLLRAEERKSAANRSQATRIMRLAAAGEVEANATVAAWKELPSPVLDAVAR